MPEERRISPTLLIIPVAGLVGVAILALAATAWAVPPLVFTCPICGAKFGTEEELNDHIETEHPEVPAADIRVEDLTITPSEVYAGEKVTISIVAKNYGSATGSKTIVCTVS